MGKTIYNVQTQSYSSGVTISLFINLIHAFGNHCNGFAIDTNTGISHFYAKINAIVSFLCIYSYIDATPSGELDCILQKVPEYLMKLFGITLHL